MLPKKVKETGISDPSVFVIGEKGFKDELTNHGIRVINPDPLEFLSPLNSISPETFASTQIHGNNPNLSEGLYVDPTVVSVIVGTDFQTCSRKQALASLYINQNNAELIGTNIDRTDGKDRLRPSGGSLVKLIEVGSGCEYPPRIMGKPDGMCFDLLRKQHGLEKEDLSKFLMIGDNLSTDILFGNQCGIDSLLVLSGVTTPDKAERVLAQGIQTDLPPGVEKEGYPTYVQSLFA